MNIGPNDNNNYIIPIKYIIKFKIFYFIKGLKVYFLSSNINDIFNYGDIYKNWLILKFLIFLIYEYLFLFVFW